MIVIGLTGSIGTGKSTVTRQFAHLGAATLDSDRVVHALLAPGGAAVEPVAKRFPEAYENRGINRRRLGAEIFADPGKRAELEAIVHPLVRKAQDLAMLRARRSGRRFLVLDIPLLFETGGEARCDCTVVTSAPFFLQRQRVLRRANMTEEKFLRILAAQMPDVEKRWLADYVIFTGQGLAASFRQVKAVLAKLRT